MANQLLPKLFERQYRIHRSFHQMEAVASSVLHRQIGDGELNENISPADFSKGVAHWLFSFTQLG